ncbi:thioredoxin, mitochondrial-like [Myxocyprinus asiaticus]|uniref:thioredoxin, mitochondrial-like n=1 Tax=Myxocyprinus asiaticus TaxID=70543 RepID=UPI00222229FF|nr:thioredoxin, mitochondrial-like [Myxocyprinus asiaticus]XP_051571835.1 thioredoxin, mitochondrial-like [Myxocyprinus asiaticus]
MMASRILMQRVCCVLVRDLRGSSSYSSSLTASATVQPFLSRTVLRSSCRSVSFNVQDHDDFTERVINSQLPVLIDFHAQWCGPCKILGPRLEKAIAKQKGRIAMAKVDIDEHTDLAIEYGVSAVPTVIAMRGGDVIDQFVGIKDEDQLDSFVEQLIGQ